ncbi:PLP-dependent transferase [Microbacter margulisiae]|uniref:O-acetylhomoserine (Thiol)-lyase n=1 Tax=Microbacter margulisiae TaxID=1350067 RepID=A0A7W5DQX3_9PORP|nr:PLP-dependent transferase [Microbacter margulisiae]MBB3187450.1 O-acetylhomoserine (thiol)-lyase [Microbacter margulisiae]
MNKEDLSFNGKLLNTPYGKPDVYGALSMPVYNSVAYEFDTAEEMEAAFTGKSADHAYSRITNPTVQYFENRIQTITGALSVTALNSGMAAISNTIITLAKTGSNIVTSKHLFGNTYSFFASTMAAFGVETRFCDLTNSDEVEARIDKDTCAVFLEIMTNPQLEVVDLKALSTICKQKEVPLVADTTIIPFCSFNAKDFGINIEIVSSTKYISGGATSLGGLILDYGNFNWLLTPKLHTMTEKFGTIAFTTKLRKEIHRNLGAYMTPQVAYMQILGLETLTLRYEKATDTCFKLVERLDKLSEVESINYTGLCSNKYYELSKSQFGDRPGAMFTFNLASREACFEFMNKLKVVRRATNLFDNKTLAIHPASTIFGTFTPEVRKEMNVSDKTIRISVGLESVEDLYADFVQALLKA